MEFVQQFGMIIMFSSVFPLAALICLTINWARLYFSRIEIKYNRRTLPQICIGIGQFMYMIEFLAHMSIVVNCAIIYFTSKTFRNVFVSEGFEQVCLGSSKSGCITVGKRDKMFIDAAGFLVVLIAVEHVAAFLKFVFVKAMDGGGEFLQKERTNDLLLK